MEEARVALAGLLDQLQHESANMTLRLQAATMANRLALFHGDTSLADVAESLAIEVPKRAEPGQAQALKTEASVARATRRAIALAHAQRINAPQELLLALVDDPDTLVNEVERRLTAKQPILARAVLDVALSRHPGSDALNALKVEVLAATGDDAGAQALAVRLADAGNEKARGWIQSASM